MKDKINQASYFLHKYFFHCIIVSYWIGGMFPRFGLWIKDTNLGTFTFMDGSKVKVSLALILLSMLLFNAGFGVKTSELKNLFQKPKLLLAGLLANLSIPIFFTFLLSITMIFWHNQNEVQNILVGLALSLGLVLFSTMLSPITTPLGLHSIGFMTEGDYSNILAEIYWQIY
ncbi:hypothetical protein [Leptospira idonii]|uniref:hypothetical protein n=1 Tax=Leptospira idonii TaxID=1193500 RepID=UPI001FEA8826|nr:hypothetical protein [Leptospira idonii]